jgi:hypothetical protein
LGAGGGGAAGDRAGVPYVPLELIMARWDCEPCGMLFNRKSVIDQDVLVADAGHLQIYVESLEEYAVASTEFFMDHHCRVRLAS